MKKKVLITYVTAGIGHKKAAIAIKKAFEDMAPADVEVSIIDALDYTSAFFKWSYLKFYLLMINKLPTLWGLSYYLTDNFYLNLIVSKLRNLSNRLNAQKFINYVIEWKPDVVISTHFFASEVISDLKRKRAIKTQLITVVTDYRLHSWWVAEPTDAYIVGGEEAKADLVRWGVNTERIKVLGIPTEPIFGKKVEKGNILERAGLEKNVFTVLVIGGGFGVGPIQAIVEKIGQASAKMQAAVICGHNETLMKNLTALAGAMQKKVKVLGFVDDVYDYMSIADVLISKSGGITVAESLAKELPMVVISPIIGQETRNSKFLTSHGAAVELKKLDDLKGLLEELASGSTRLDKMKQAIEKIRKPSASYDVVRLAVFICSIPS